LKQFFFGGGEDVIHETKRFIATLPEEKQVNVANMHRKFCDVRTKGFKDMLADRHTRTLIQYSAPQTAGRVNISRTDVCIEVVGMELLQRRISVGEGKCPFSAFRGQYEKWTDDCACALNVYTGAECESATQLFMSQTN